MVTEKYKLLIRVFNTSLPSVKLRKTVAILSIKWLPLGDHMMIFQPEVFSVFVKTKLGKSTCSALPGPKFLVLYALENLIEVSNAGWFF